MTDSFQAQLDAAYQKKVVERLDKGVRIATLQVFTNLVENTPVDTGRAKMGWNVDINIVDVTIPEPTGKEPGKHEGDRQYNGQEKALGVTAKYKTEDIVYISNNLPYIVPLNEGHSQQAPTGFIDRAISVGTRQAEELINQI